jgi:hypothetical protein
MLGVDAAGATVAHSKIWLHGGEAERFGPARAGARRSPRMAAWSCDLQGYRRSTARRGHRGLGIDAYVAASRSTRTWRRLSTSVHAEPRSLTGSGWPGELRGPNRWGFARTAGRSAIWTPDGIAVSRAGPDRGEVARATLA